jgi:hypothetical protein
MTDLDIVVFTTPVARRAIDKRKVGTMSDLVPVSTKIKPSKALPTDRLKFSKQTDALRALAIGSANGTVPVNAKKLSSLIHVAETTAPLNNTFFHSIGLAERRGKSGYVPAGPTLEYARQLSFNKPDAGHVLAPNFERSWFYEAVVERLAMGNATKGDLIENLSRIAGADANYKTQMGSLIEWLEYAGLIEIDGEDVTLTKGVGIGGDAPGSRGAELRGPTPDTPTPAKVTEPTTPQVVESPTVLSMSIELSLTVEDLAKLSAEQVTALFQGVGQVASIKAALAS